MAVLVSDSFNRAGSTTLGTTDSLYGGTAKVWTDIVAGMGISANQAYNPSVNIDTCSVVDAGNANVKITATMSVYGAEDAIYFRVTDNLNYWRVIAVGTLTYLQRFVANVKTNAASFSFTPVAGDVWSIVVNANAIEVFINGVSKCTLTDSANNTATKHGIGQGGRSATTRFDDFKVEDLATGTAYTKSLSDSVTTSDTISKLLSVTVFDSLSTSDGSSKADAKTLTDAMTVSDNPLTVNKGKAVNLSDSVSIVDAISKSLTLIRSDSVATLEAESKSTIRSLLDSLTQSDSLSVIGGKAVLLSDSVTVSDSIRKAINLSKSDALAPTDNLTRIANTSVRLYDTLVTTETFSKSIPNAPVIIGTIELKASRELYVYLLASRELTINLKGALPVAEKNQNISMYASESKIVGFTATDSYTGAALPLTGATLKWAMRRSNSKTNDLAKALNSGITVTNAAAGKFTVTFNPADTVNLSGDFMYQAEVIDASGFENVVATGRVAISKNINK